MIKVYIFLVFTFLGNYCTPQAISNSIIENNHAGPKTRQNEELHGIIYLSFDNANHWVDASNGLPEKVSIGLGGIAVSNQILGVATKEKGIYQFNFQSKRWVKIPTEEQIIDGNIGALAIFENAIYVGTQYKGVFCSKDGGKTWRTLNSGLKNLTIRRLCEFNHRLFVCTNDGFYCLGKDTVDWQLLFGKALVQVNGATLFNGRFYLATNKGIFKQQNDDTWLNIAPKLILHNISSDKDQIYAMTYNELLLTSSDGITWESRQSGLPENLYTFNVLTHNNTILAGQWDGIYRLNNIRSKWELSSNGLRTNFAVTNLKMINNILVISTSERKLKEGYTTE